MGLVVRLRIINFKVAKILFESFLGIFWVLCASGVRQFLASHKTELQKLMSVNKKVRK